MKETNAQFLQSTKKRRIGHEQAGLTDKGACVKACVKMGSKYVLFNAASKTIYELDDQTKPEEFAGKEVKITGTFDTATKTIHVVSIKVA